LRIDWLLIRRALRGRWLALPLLGLLAYFTWHTLHGPRSLPAWVELRHEIEASRAELDRLRQEREALDRRVAGLGRDALDPDLLEEELRKLGYVAEREVVVLVPEREASPPGP
jgi:cell division protein FtsB